MPKAKENVPEFAARILEQVGDQLQDILNLAVDYKVNIIDKLSTITNELSELRSLLGITILLGIVNLLLTIGVLLFK